MLDRPRNEPALKDSRDRRRPPVRRGLALDYHTMQVLTNMYWRESAMRGRVPRQRDPTSKQRETRADLKSRRQIDRPMKPLGAMPQILCWNCRKLTSFEVDKCEHCGSAFAGSTGGAYRSGLIPTNDLFPASTRIVEPRGRSLSEIVADLRRVHDLADSPREPSRGNQGSLPLYQCPTCGRFVAETATACVCGVRFAPPSAVTFLCPECGASVPSAADVCPVCRIEFRATGPRDEYVYACPRCGAHVASDAFQCSCGARFED